MAGANVVLDVKMRTIPLGVENSMDFTLVGTAAWVEGMPPSDDPIVATVPALEFVKLLEADIVPTGIAVGAQYNWLNDGRAIPVRRSPATSRRPCSASSGSGYASARMPNCAATPPGKATACWRTSISARCSRSRRTGNQDNFSAGISWLPPRSTRRGRGRPANNAYGARRHGANSKARPAVPHEIGMVVDMHAGKHAVDRHHAPSPVLRVQRTRGSDLTCPTRFPRMRRSG